MVGSRHGSEGACRIHKLEVASSNHGGGTIFQKKIVEICEDGELNIEFSQERERESKCQKGELMWKYLLYHVILEFTTKICEIYDF